MRITNDLIAIIFVNKYIKSISMFKCRHRCNIMVIIDLIIYLQSILLYTRLKAVFSRCEDVATKKRKKRGH